VRPPQAFLAKTLVSSLSIWNIAFPYSCISGDKLPKSGIVVVTILLSLSPDVKSIPFVECFLRTGNKSVLTFIGTYPSIVNIQV
jgi:hypothetical protein